MFLIFSELGIYKVLLYTILEKTTEVLFGKYNIDFRSLSILLFYTFNSSWTIELKIWPHWTDIYWNLRGETEIKRQFCYFGTRPPKQHFTNHMVSITSVASFIHLTHSPTYLFIHSANIVNSHFDRIGDEIMIKAYTFPILLWLIV